MCGVVTRYRARENQAEWYDSHSNGVIEASGAAESANIATYALMAFLKVGIL
jgi:hypothetical protein